MEAKGVTGTIIFDGKFVTIRRAGFLGRVTVGKGEKRIPLRSISAVQWKPAGMVRGFISFSLAGGVEKQSRFGHQATDAAKDENSVLFKRSQQADFEQLRAAVDEGLAGVA